MDGRPTLLQATNGDKLTKNVTSGRKRPLAFYLKQPPKGLQNHAPSRTASAFVKSPTLLAGLTPRARIQPPRGIHSASN
jgi:hypothetical protein